MERSGKNLIIGRTSAECAGKRNNLYKKLLRNFSFLPPRDSPIWLASLQRLPKEIYHGTASINNKPCLPFLLKKIHFWKKDSELERLVGCFSEEIISMSAERFWFSTIGQFEAIIFFPHPSSVFRVRRRSAGLMNVITSSPSAAGVVEQLYVTLENPNLPKGWKSNMTCTLLKPTFEENVQ